MMIATAPLRAQSLLLSALLVSTVSSLSAQQSTPSSPTAQKPQGNDLVFKSIVNRVILDVVVTDAQGKPVRGLDRRDFSVTEDGVPQRLLSFDLRDLDAASESLPPNLPPLPVNTFLNLPRTPEKGPLYVLLLDLVNTEVPDQMWARQQLLKFIKEKPEGTRFAVFLLSDGLHLVQGFTSDKELLYAAVDPSHPKHHVPKVFLYSSNYGRGNRGMMISVFEDIGRYLDGLPGRKNVMWMAASFPMSMVPVEGDPYDLTDDLKHAINTLARAQAAVYTLALCGLSADNAACGADPNADNIAGRGAAARPVYNAAISKDVATATGGKSYYLNDLKGELSEATENGANYYTLSYAPSNTNYNGELRSIKVELAKRGYQLAYRRSYFADDPNAPVVRKVSAKDEPQPEPPRKPGDSLIANMEFGAPMAHQFIFRAHLQAVGVPALGTPAQMANLSEQPAYFQVRRKNRPVKPLKPIPLQTYVIDYVVLLPPKAEGERPVALEFATAAFDVEGTMLNGVVENGTRITSGEPRLSQVQVGTAPSGSKERGIYRAQQRIDVPVGAASIRVAVRDMFTDRIGAMEVNLPLASEP
jgi:VWFA-related protein